MTSIYAYRRAIDSITTHTLRLPEPAAQGIQSGQEIATLADGRTIVVICQGYTLSADQPAAIKASIEVLSAPAIGSAMAIVLAPDLRDAIKAASPHVRLINDRVRDAIAQRYSITDEIKLIRTAPSAEMLAYNAYAEECRAWGWAEKAKLGL